MWESLCVSSLSSDKVVIMKDQLESAFFILASRDVSTPARFQPLQTLVKALVPEYRVYVCKMYYLMYRKGAR